jgi:hypothetical protein
MGEFRTRDPVAYVIMFEKDDGERRYHGSELLDGQVRCAATRRLSMRCLISHVIPQASLGENNPSSSILSMRCGRKRVRPQATGR